MFSFYKILLISILFTFMGASNANEIVNIFSARHYDSDVQLYEKFTKKTGIKVNVVAGKDKALQKRILNASRGPAVWALRAQTDKRLYSKSMLRI